MKNPILKFFLLAMLFVLVSIAPATSHKFESKAANYSIIFPSEFTIEDESSETFSSMSAQALFDEQLFFAAHHVHQAELIGIEELTQLSLDAFVDGVNGTIINQKEWMVSENKGIHASVVSQENDLVGEYKVVIIDKIQYQLTVASEKGKWNEANAAKFFNSFKFKKQERE